MTLPHISMFGYRLFRVNFTGGTQLQMYFSISDEALNRQRWLWWRENIPGRAEQALDFATISEPGYHVKKVEIIGNDKAPATDFELADKSVTLDNLVRDGAAKIGLIKTSHKGGILVRMDQDGGGHHFLLKFGGEAPADIVDKVIIGTIVTATKTAKWSAKKPWIPEKT